MKDLCSELSSLSLSKRVMLERVLLQERATLAGLEAIRPRQRASIPLSFAQERLWFLDQLAAGNPFYNINSAVRLIGALVEPALRESLWEMVRRHEVLRTKFGVVAELAVQEVEAELKLELPVVDLRFLAATEREDVARQISEQQAGQAFDLARLPLLRAVLVRLRNEEHWFVCTMHHIISDGWSMGVFVREVARLYEAFVTGEASPLGRLPIQYGDYAEWQREWLKGGVLTEQLRYWKEQLAGAPTVLELPTDRMRRGVQSYRGSSERVELSKELRLSLEEVGRREGVTLFMTLLAAWQVLLQRYTNQEQIVVGTPIAGRTRREVEGLIGFFANTLVLRTDLGGDPSFRELLKRVREVCLGAYSNQDLPFEKLVEELQPERTLSHNPLVQVIFGVHEAILPSMGLPALTISPCQIDSNTAKFDLTLNVEKAESGLKCTAEYNADLFDALRVERILRHFQNLLKGITEDPTRTISRLPLLSDTEYFQLSQGGRDTNWRFDGEQRLHAIFERQVAEIPDAVAVSMQGAELTYGELDGRANQLARHLVVLGVGLESRVGILVERSLEMVIGLLGVLKAGGAYVPLDPEYPGQRLSYMVRDAGVSVLLAQEHLVELVAEESGVVVVCLDSGWEEIGREGVEKVRSGIGGENLAYILYTSGSTGEPKGVMVRHESLTNHMQWMQERYPLVGGDCVLQKTALSFDASVWELLAPLLAGARLELARTGGQRESGYLVSSIRTAGVTVLQVVPSQLRMLLGEAGFSECRSLRRVFYGGAAISGAFAEEYYRRQGAELINLYGPTETTIEVTSWECRRGVGGSDVLPIGIPIWNTKVYVMDEWRQLMVAGGRGELYVGGMSVGRGYLNRRELTAERFVPDEFSAEVGARVYRTGDVGRYIGGGVLECLGRVDEQVKVRGYRVELGEVEAALLRHEGVREAVVVTREDESGEQQLVVCVVEEGEGRGWRQLQDWLKGELPHYMVPSIYVSLKEMPLLSNGKVDRRKLAELGAVSRQPGNPVRETPETMTPVEEILAGIWREVLGVNDVGRTDNFFDLGGHSLLATQLISRMRKTFEIDLALAKLYDSTNLAELALGIEEELRKAVRKLPLPPITKRKPDGDLLLSFAQQRLWFLDQLEPNNIAYNTPAAVRLTGLLKIAALGQTIGAVVQRHEVLRTSFQTVEGRPVQYISRDAHMPLLITDLSGLEVRESEDIARRLALEEARRHFDLSQSPLLRLCVLRIRDEQHLFVVVMHHIIADGWSMGLLVSEMESLYGPYVQGVPGLLPELPIQYADYALWQREWLQGEVLKEQLAYWSNQLAGAPEDLGLPTDKPRPRVATHRGSRLELTLSRELTQQLADVSRQEGVTLFMLLLAGFQLLLWRYSEQLDVCIGSPIAGRNLIETEPLMGFFVNTLVLRTVLKPEESFRELLQRVRKVCLSAYEYQELPFERLVEELRPIRDLGRTPMIQVFFNMLNLKHATGLRPVTLPGLNWTPLELDTETATFDIGLSVADSPEGLLLTFGYSTDLYHFPTIQGMSRHFEALLQGIVEDPAQNLCALAKRIPRQKVTIVIASTFVADSIQESLSFCLNQLHIPHKIEMTPYSQVFQQLLHSSSTLLQNRDGVNLILLRPDDLLQPGADDSVRD